MAGGDKRDGAGKRCRRCTGPLAYAGASLACIVAAIAAFDSHWLLDEPARTAIAGALMAMSIILAFAVVLSAAVSAVSAATAPSPHCVPGKTRRVKPLSDTKVADKPVPPGTILSVFAVTTVAAIALAAVVAAPTYAPHPYPTGHMGVV